jgi:hypothetical protein
MDRPPEAITDTIRDEVSAEIKRDIARCKERHTKYQAYTVDVILNVGGCETVCRAEVHFEYTPEEPRAWDYPGYPAWAEILRVMVGDKDILWLMSKEAVEELEESLV